MTLLWRESMAIGDPRIDGDHRCLVGMINTVELALHREPEQVRAALDQLVRFAGEHFEREERLQQALGYPGCREHADAHAELAARLGDIRDHIVESMHPENERDLARLMQRLRHWLIEHIVREDLPLRPFVHAHAPLEQA